MTQKERRDMELPYRADEAVVEEMKQTRRLLREFNTADPCDYEKQAEITEEDKKYYYKKREFDIDVFA